MLVTRFFHIRPWWGVNPKRNGATVLVTGNTDDPAQVDVQVAFCSRKDAYCKKTGRSTAAKAPIKVVMLRNLPRELARIDDAVNRMVGSSSSNWSSAIRYFLPKE